LNWQYADIANLQNQLRADEAIVDYMVTDDSLYAFALTRFDLRVFRSSVTRRVLQAAVDSYLHHLTADREKNRDYNEQILRQEFLQTVELSHNLYDQLLGGMAGFLERVNRIYIVPDEFLHALPFSTLAKQLSIDPQFLIATHAVMYLPATSLLTNQLKKAHNLGRPALLASIDPAMYGAQETRNHVAALLNENATIRTRWKDEASLLTELANGYEVCFFYAHAEAKWDNPQQSYIQYPLNESHSPGRLTYAQIDSVNFHKTVLVILAGCETTGSRIYRGAGLSGLQRSFLASGAKQVLATLWEVDAAQVASQMSEFLTAWYRSGDAMLALQTIQKNAIFKLRQDPYLKFPYPRFWGAYNLTGITSSSSLPYYTDKFLQ
jgi:CHAT domain-containing protein